MKIIRTALLIFCFLLLTPPAYAQQSSTEEAKQMVCERTANIAYNAMINRQRDVPIEIQVAASHLIQFEAMRTVAIIIINEAYELPFVQHGWVKQKLSIDFTREWFRKCDEMPLEDSSG